MGWWGSLAKTALSKVADSVFRQKKMRVGN